MIRALTSPALLFLFCLGTHAATINTNLTVDATASLSPSGAFTANGNAVLTNVGPGKGTFSASATVTTLSEISNVIAPFTITMAGASGGTLKGGPPIPVAAFTKGSSVPMNFSLTITGGTGAFAGVTASTFSQLPGTASSSSVAAITLHLSGAGTINSTGAVIPPPADKAPEIADVLDAASYTRNIAQGSIFVVKGSNLSADGFNQFGFPLPTGAGGVKITFTPAAGGAGTDARLIYLYNQDGVNQLAAILPSTLPAGNYNVTVTNGAVVSGSVAATVVQRKAGIFSQDTTGAGLAVVQNFISATRLDV